MSEDDPDFERWCYTATDDRHMIDGSPVPMLTTLIYRVCNGDAEKFGEALHIVRSAFDAGKRALNSQTGTQTDNSGTENSLSAKSEDA